MIFFYKKTEKMLLKLVKIICKVYADHILYVNQKLDGGLQDLKPENLVYKIRSGVNDLSQRMMPLKRL